MSTLTALARLEAVRAGVAQPVATVRHCHLAAAPLAVVVLRLAGEAAAPLAVLLGDDRDDPRLLIVPQPRSRALRFAFAAELAAEMLPYLAAFEGAAETLTRGSGETFERALDAPQLLVPNPGGVDFLRLLGRSTRFRRTEGPYPVPASVPLLGRWLTWLTDRSAHPGSSVLLPLTSTLAAHWATGQSPLEDADLAALVGWIAPPDGLTGPQAAAAAEDPLRHPPAGPATDPGFDNRVLAPLVTGYDRAVAALATGSASAAADAAVGAAVARLREALLGQLMPTWRLMWQGVDLLRGLSAGGSVAGRWEGDRAAFSRFTETVGDGVPQPRRDGAVSAVRRLLSLERAAANLEIERALDDPLVMAERRLAGAAFAGAVVMSDPTRTDTGGKRARLRPYLRVATADAVSVAAGDTVHNTARAGQQGLVVEVADGTVLLELSGGMGNKLVPAQGSVPEVGDRVCFATFSRAFQPGAGLPEPEDTPWTHGGPPEPYTPRDDDATEAWE